MRPADDLSRPELTAGGDVVVTLRGPMKHGSADVGSTGAAPARAPPALEGRTVGVLEARMTDTSRRSSSAKARAVVRAPALAEAVVDATAEIKAWTETLVEDRYDIVVFLTGVGVTRLLDEIERLGYLDAVRAALGRTTVVAPRPEAVGGARPARHRRRRSRVPGAVDDAGRRRHRARACRSPASGSALVHFGERNAPARRRHPGGAARRSTSSGLRVAAAGRPRPARRAGRRSPSTAASTRSSSPARSRCATSSRWRRRSEREAPLIEALNAWTVTASIGPTCSAALVARGIAPRIEPTRPKLRPARRARRPVPRRREPAAAERQAHSQDPSPGPRFH